MLTDRNIAQVSMNLTNYERTPIHRVFEVIKREAERYGVAVLESEIVGLVPSAALLAATARTCNSPGSTTTRRWRRDFEKWKSGKSGKVEKWKK